MSNKLPIILGSASKGRKEVLEKLGWKFTIMAANIDEKAIRFEDPSKLTLVLANAKADALLPKINTEALLITSDQVIDFKGQIREKPENEQEARAFLRSYKDHPATNVTGLAVTNTKTGERLSGVEISKVYFKEIPENIIDQLIKQGDIFSQAGGFSTWNPILKPYVDRIEGEEENVIGLPVAMTKKFIKELTR